MAEITGESKAMAQPYEIMGIGKVRGIEEIHLGDKVMKRGRTTQKTMRKSYSCGNRRYCLITRDIHVILWIKLPLQEFQRQHRFRYQGIQGSVIVSANKSSGRNSYGVKALLFAGGRSEDGID